MRIAVALFSALVTFAGRGAAVPLCDAELLLQPSIIALHRTRPAAHFAARLTADPAYASREIIAIGDGKVGAWTRTGRGLRAIVSRGCWVDEGAAMCVPAP